jgi:hypothetical protein
MWLCKCDCDGNEKVYHSGNLKNGYTSSCGCLCLERIKISNKEKKKKYNTYDLTGEYGIGYTFKGEEFYFDLEDYDKIKNYCWRIDNNGYVVSRDNSKIIKIHRHILNCTADMTVDHINHKKIDNRKKNLRIVTNSQNSMNTKINSKNTSGCKGVNYDKRNNKWVVRIGLNRKRIHIGYFDDFEEAVKVRKKAEVKYHGEFRYKGEI